MTEEVYKPYRNINTIEDLLLVRRVFDLIPDSVDLPEAHYPGEIVLWLDLDVPVDQTFSPDGQNLVAAEVGANERGWQLSISPHGYLRFESGTGDDMLWTESKVPLHSFLRDGEPFRVGLSISNMSHGLRGTGYAAENKAFNRLRLYVAPRQESAMTLCGWLPDFVIPDMAAVPRKLWFRAAERPVFCGRITGLTAYNTSHMEMFNHPGAPSADAVIPAIPGGGGFNPRWISEDTIEVLGRPEFSGTGSAWIYMKIADNTGRLQTLCIRSLWSGIATMNPTFFISSDGDHWERIAPEKIDMRPDSMLYSVWLTLDEQQSKGCFISTAIPFLPRHRRDFMEWARSEFKAHISVPGQSVEKRDIPVIRIGPDDPDRFHAVFICGQHSPAEIMTARLLRPMLEEAARLKLLSRCVFHLFPTVNVDCAHYGGNGLNANGRNTNRHWFDNVQPENQAVIDYLCDLKQRGCKVAFGIDLHAGGVWRNHLLYRLRPTGTMPLSEEYLSLQSIWTRLLEEHAGLRRQESGGLPRGRKYAMDRIVDLFDCPAFLLELSLASWFDPREGATRPFAQESLDVTGRGIARAIAEVSGIQ